MRAARKVLSILFACVLLHPALNSQILYEQTFKFGKVLEWIDRYYVDSVNEEQLVENAIIELLNELDPHSSYLSRDEVARLNEPLQGSFEGIGVTFAILKDTIYIIKAIEEGPSFRAGILPGDRILAIEGKNVAGNGITTQEVYDQLRGRKGTSVTVTVKRTGEEYLRSFTMERDEIPIYSIDAVYKVDNNIGYIKINRFSQTTGEEFARAIESLKKQKVNSLILDLTGNGGGYLEAAINLADQFLDEDKLIVYTEGSNSPKKDYLATRAGSFEKGHLVILIDEGTASASEIVTGAVQDWDRGIVIGRRSYGKGLVQKPLLLPDQSLIRLTVAKYYTPTGRLIQKPYDKGKDAYDLDLLNRYQHGELAHKDSIRLDDSLKFYTLRNSRLVYGNGGIMPDYFVSIDTSYYSAYYRRLVSADLLNHFVLHYLDANRYKLLRQYPEFEGFKNEFQPDGEFMSAFHHFVGEQSESPADTDYLQSDAHIRMLLKAFIARNLWSTSEFYSVSNELDPNFETAVTILRNWDKYEVMLLKEK